MLTFKTQGSCLCGNALDEFIRSYRLGMEISPEHNVILCQRVAMRLPALDLMLHGGVDVHEGGKGGKKELQVFKCSSGDSQQPSGGTWLRAA